MQSKDHLAVPVFTAGQLRLALEGVPDDRIIVAQVVGGDGSAWNLRATFTPQVPGGSIGALTLSHPDLRSLGAAEFQQHGLMNKLEPGGTMTHDDRYTAHEHSAALRGNAPAAPASGSGVL